MVEISMGDWGKHPLVGVLYQRDVVEISMGEVTSDGQRLSWAGDKQTGYHTNGRKLRYQLINASSILLFKVISFSKGFNFH